MVDKRLKSKKLPKQHGMWSLEDRQCMRIIFKKQRYTLEFFATRLNKKGLAPYLAELSKLQEELGLINDQLTAETMINNLHHLHLKGPAQGWVVGRQELLIRKLPEMIGTWLDDSTQEAFIRMIK